MLYSPRGVSIYLNDIDICPVILGLQATPSMCIVTLTLCSSEISLKKILTFLQNLLFMSGEQISEREWPSKHISA
jgi:hypothetical protein